MSTFQMNDSTSGFFSNVTASPSAGSAGTGQASSSASDFVSSYENFAFYFNTIAVSIVCILGTLGNLASILVLQKDRYNRVAIFLLQVLALADSFLLAVSFVALTVIFGFCKRFMNDFTLTILPYIIKYINPIAIISQCFVIWSTVLLALNRYAAVCRPFTSKRWLKLSSARVQVFVVLAFSIGLNFPRFFIYDIVDDQKTVTRVFIGNSSSSSCGSSSNSTNASALLFNCSVSSAYNASVNITHGKTNRPTLLGSNEAFNLYYLSIFYTSFILVLPLILLVGLNVPLIRQLQKSKRRMKDNCLAYDGKNEDNITWTMVVIIIGLVICHTPERICEIVRHLSGNENSGPTMLYAINISNFLVMVNSSTDFVVYYVLKTRFRKEFWRKVYTCLKKDKELSTDESYNQTERQSIARNGSKTQNNHGRSSDSDIELDSMNSQNRYRRLNNSLKEQQRQQLKNQKPSDKLPLKEVRKPHQNSVKPLAVELNGGKLMSSISSSPKRISSANSSKITPMRSGRDTF